MGGFCRFTINGLGVGDISASKTKATGEVYQLARIFDVEGVYGQVRLGEALANQGDGRLWLQNDRGVTLRLRTKREGLMLGQVEAAGFRTGFLERALAYAMTEAILESLWWS